jgi:8-oxo-dGTP diphosphatase
MADYGTSDSQPISAEWATSLAVACAFFTDPAGNLLIVKPNYREDWLFVGGLVDVGETPHEACAREIKEEIGLDRPVGDLLVVDWAKRADRWNTPITFWLFDGGVIQSDDDLVLQADEIDDARFSPADEAVALLADFNRPRVTLAFEARRIGRTMYQPAT